MEFVEDHKAVAMAVALAPTARKASRVTVVGAVAGAEAGGISEKPLRPICSAREAPDIRLRLTEAKAEVAVGTQA